MTIPSIIYGQYLPQEIWIKNLAVGVTSNTNDLLNFTDTQYLLVGEKFLRTNDSYYSLIVDDTGIAVNTSLPTRTNNVSQYGLYVDGSVFVTGNIISNGNPDGSGGILLGAGSNDGSIVNNSVSSWLPSDSYNNIWFDGTATLGNYYDSSNNGYTLNIIQSADRTIDHAQISIQNNKYSQMRMGIVGTGTDSPSIINTPPGIPLEFHMGRDQSYFNNLYSKYDWITYTRENGTTYTCNVLFTTETPQYQLFDNNSAPHIIIDNVGNVGIHTSSNVYISYQLRAPNPISEQNITWNPITEQMKLHVDGSFYASNILMYDYDTESPQHLDSLYIRRLGVTIPATQIVPGPFANGDYSFVSNLSLTSGDLTVNGNGHIYQDMLVDGSAILNQIIAKDAILLDVASFCNDVYVNRDMIINHAVRIRGQIFTEILSNVSIVNGVPRSNYAWQMINFSPASPSLQNINYIGQGIATPGRLGVGIDVNVDSVNNQVSIFKRDPTIFELELHDMSSPYYRKGGFIGHPTIDSTMEPDGSLAIVTPSLNDTDYKGIYGNGVEQNIYFFPGNDLGPTAPPIIREDNPPTLGIFQSGNVGLGTYNPIKTLDVRGDIVFTGDMYYNNLQTGILNKIGLWKSVTLTNVLYGQNITFKGIQFINPDSSNVGINVAPEPNYALVVGNGAIKSYNGYYIPSDTGYDRKVANWMDSQDLFTLTNNVAPNTPFSLFSYGSVGIGVAQPSAILEVKSNYSQSTFIKLDRGDNSVEPITGIEFAGVNQSWKIQANDDANRLEIGYGSNTFSSDNSARALWIYNDPVMQNQRVIIGADLNSLTNTFNNIDPTAVLNVGGNIAVNGDVNITGTFRINTQPLVNNAIVNSSSDTISIANKDDVYIGGGNIALMPGTDAFGNSLGFYLTNNTDPNSIYTVPNVNNSLFNVYQTRNNVPYVATFRTSSSTGTGLISIMSGTSTSATSELRFGMVNPSNSSSGLGNVFGFFDKNMSPYLTFNIANNASIPSVGFGTSLPTALIHCYSNGSGSNMLRLTKYAASGDTSSASPEIDFEKAYRNQQSTKWTIKGPNAGYNQKLGFIYTGPEYNYQPNEIFTFTNDGCIGIGTTIPQFALDIANIGKKGSLRLLNTDITGTPQLIFESGNPIYGSDIGYDFRMVATSNQFVLDMQNINQQIPIMSINSNGFIGFNTDPSNLYNVNVNGIINVGTAIYLGGHKLFSAGGASSLDTGLTLSALNVYLQPVPNYFGGVILNGSVGTSNLFHIYSGRNANMTVYDSLYNENQIHFRNQYIQNTKVINNMYRMSMSNTVFQWEYWGNCGNNGEITSTHLNYNPVLQWYPSTYNSNEYNTTLYGNINLIANNPLINLNTNGFIGGSNNNMYINANNNIGFGTTLPQYNTHIYNSTIDVALHIDQNSTNCNILELFSNNTNRFVVDINGNVGIGSTLPQNSLDLIGNINVTGGYSFASNINSGLYYQNDTLLINNDTYNTVSINSNNVLINTNININNSLNIPALNVIQNGSNLIAKFISPQGYSVIDNNGNIGICTSNIVSALTVNGDITVTGNILPYNSISYDIGSSINRWRDIYLSGSTIDLNGSKISQNSSNGAIVFSNSNGLTDLIANAVQLGDDTTPSRITIGISQYNNIEFTSTNNTDGSIVNFTPLFLSNDTLGIGTGTTQAALHIVNHSNQVGCIIAQDGVGDLVQLYSDDIQKIGILKNGNVGIGSTIPESPLVINGSNTSYISKIKQTNPLGNVATFINATGSSININNTGYLGINTTTPVVPLHVVGGQYYDGYSYFNSNVYINMNLEVYGDAIAHGNQIVDSDRRLKDNIEKIENALEKVQQLSGYTFTKKDTGKRSTGLIAQEVEKVLPEVVSMNGEYLGIAYGNMIGLLVEAIKELSIAIKK